MEKEKLGQEPAFPISNENAAFALIKMRVDTTGMSKRFYAACAAMNGLIANSYIQWTNATDIDLISKSYELADELLKQENL